MIWWRYHWPGHGKVQATWRRFNNPHVEVLYSLLFWAALLLWGFIIYFIYAHSATAAVMVMIDGPWLPQNV
jgi:hypothetical protein